MSARRERIVVAMSGGVDSSVAAALLRDRGYDVVGLFMRNGITPQAAAARGKQGCCSLDDAADARRVAALLDVPFYCVDFSEGFDRVIDDFVAEYNRGRTPNPCIQCNRWLKFGHLLDRADALGAQRVATGHYARIVRRSGRSAVARGADADKDQSYVLFPLSQDQLARCELPLGDIDKGRVRAIARELGLPVGDKPDSQEICFVPDGRYRSLIERRAPGSVRPGPILDRAGNVVGEHPGHQLFTIGQRRGLGLAFGAPRHVVEIRPDSNAIVIGEAEELAADGLVFSDPIWSGAEPPAIGESLHGSVQIRYRHRPVPATIQLCGDGRVAVRFVRPVRAVAPGQAAVVYDDAGVVLVGGYIDASVPAADVASDS